MDTSSLKISSALSASTAQISMDNYELSGEDYAIFKAERKDADWVSYLRERSKADMADQAAFARRLQQTRTVRIKLNTSGSQAALSAIPLPEQIRHLSLAHNQLQG